MNLVWLTDLHFDFVEPVHKQMFLREVALENPDVVLITGDISRSNFLDNDLTLIAQELIPAKVYCVSGNHDYYGSSFARADALMDSVCVSHPNLHFMGKGEIIELTPEVGLVGHHGWGDGRTGSGIHSPVQMNDFFSITDLISLWRQDLFAKLESLGRESADYFLGVLPQALSKYQTVYVITHVPPFVEASKHEGKPSDADFLPFFCNLSAGEAIREVAKQFPDRKIIVLCGHTHSQCHYTEGNIECRVGEVIYREPSIQAVFKLN